ncbi:MAG: GHMP kinase [Candidatus Wolfebacteria bacterium]|nr:GHMP kinase [Candidatus Wolfebacteria bacterium]
MIIVRAPLRISFVGGGTDMPDFYTQYPGRVISAAINKFIYITINHIPHTKKVIVKYVTTETVDSPHQLNHTRVKEALLDLGILKDIEIASFADISSRAGLGSSSVFTVALLKGLNAFLGKNLNKQEIAEAASRLEIDLLKEPVGKQDQYAAAFGGVNIFQFNTDHSVTVKPVLLSYKIKKNLEDHLLLFFTGVTRDASSVLSDQKTNINSKLETLKQMADSVADFEKYLLSGNFEKLGQMLDEGWKRKRELSSKISNNTFDVIYDSGKAAGAWGGKILGAGGGGCMLFLVPSEKREEAKASILETARSQNLSNFEEIPFNFTECGVDIVYRDDRK